MRQTRTKITVVRPFESAYYAANLRALRRLAMQQELANVLLFAWSEVEYFVDTLVLWDFLAREVKIFRQNSDDARTPILTELPFWRKVSFLRKRDIITRKEVLTVQTFQKARNRMFHRRGKDVLNVMFIGEESSKIMSNSIATVQALYSATRRYIWKKRLRITYER